MKRRQVIFLPFLCSAALGGTPFWTKKPPSEWSPAEVEEFRTHSPWAVRTALEGGRPGTMDSGGSNGTFGGMHGADSNGISVSRRGSGASSSSPARSLSVLIRWESARPMLEASGWTLPPAFQDCYAIGVTGLPPAVLIGAVGGTAGAARPEEGVKQLLASTTLAGRGSSPQPAAFLVQSTDRASLIFGFQRSAQTFSLDDKAILFAIELGSLRLHARFEPKAMIFDGKLSL